MAKILCSISGIQFSCDHVPILLQGREACHPIFHLPFKNLYKLFHQKWKKQELTEIDSYLLYLAFFKSTDRVEFRVPAERTSLSTQIVARNIERLEGIITRAIYDFHPNLHLAQFVISPETKNLTNSHIWIQTWEQNYENWENGYKREKQRLELKTREHKLEELDFSRDPIKFAKILSHWAAEAFNFPQDTTWNNILSKETDISSYWQHIIQMCVKDEQIFLIPPIHLEELIDHCFEDPVTGCNSDIALASSIYTAKLKQILRAGFAKRLMFEGKGGSTKYHILDTSTTVEDANKLALIANAPEKEPKKEDYPDDKSGKFKFMRDKYSYQLKMKQEHELQGQEGRLAKQEEFLLTSESPTLDTDSEPEEDDLSNL